MSKSEKFYVPSNEYAYAFMQQAVDSLFDEARRVVGRHRRREAMCNCLRYTIMGLMAYEKLQDAETQRRAAKTLEELQQQLQRISNAPT